VNGAADVRDERAGTAPLGEWHRVMDINVTGSFLMSRAAGAVMQRAGRGGVIVNIASIAGPVDTAAETIDAVGESASKGAVIALTRDLAVKWAGHGIRVNAIAPLRPVELQGAALFLASRASSSVNGHVLVVDGPAATR
jgi:gluconate 5-dehydrogenase